MDHPSLSQWFESMRPGAQQRMRHARRMATTLALVLVLLSGALAQGGLSFAVSTASAHGLSMPNAKPKPNHVDPHANATSTNHLPTRPTLHVQRTTNVPAPLQRAAN